MSQTTKHTFSIHAPEGWPTVIGRNIMFVSVMASTAAIGWLLHSEAVQWLAALLFLFLIIVKSAGFKTYYTIAEARAALDEIERDMRREAKP